MTVVVGLRLYPAKSNVLPGADDRRGLRLMFPAKKATRSASISSATRRQPQEDVNVTLKDRAATLWCKNADALGLVAGRYVKVRNKDFAAGSPACSRTWNTSHRQSFEPDRTPGDHMLSSCSGGRPDCRVLFAGRSPRRTIATGGAMTFSPPRPFTP